MDFDQDNVEDYGDRMPPIFLELPPEHEMLADVDDKPEEYHEQPEEYHEQPEERELEARTEQRVLDLEEEFHRKMAGKGGRQKRVRDGPSRLRRAPRPRHRPSPPPHHPRRPIRRAKVRSVSSYVRSVDTRD